MIAALAGLAAYATIMLRGPQGVSALEEKRREIRTLEEQNANLRRDIEAKKLRIERLKNDPGTQEVEIEKRLGKVRPGVTEFRELGQHLAPDAGKASGTSTDALKPAQP
ncbi:MAG TPA: septum formation initiator family protein [Bryobacteraceae bacterium]|nr:septum formation initiator family protein [Bryobacteraceae bacterium]